MVPRIRLPPPAPSRPAVDPFAPRRDFSVQKSGSPAGASDHSLGATRWSASRHPTQWLRATPERRSSRRLWGRFDRRRGRASCCRATGFSSVSRCGSYAARRAPRRAITRGAWPHGSHARSALRPVAGGSFGKTTGTCLPCGGGGRQSSPGCPDAVQS